jgi:hypothetical protein
MSEFERANELRAFHPAPKWRHVLSKRRRRRLGFWVGGGVRDNKSSEASVDGVFWYTKHVHYTLV